MLLGNLSGKTPKQVLSGDADFVMPPNKHGHITVHVLLDSVATFTYAYDANAVAITALTLDANTWLIGLATFEQASGLSACYLN